jgi:hypothetical protein
LIFSVKFPPLNQVYGGTSPLGVFRESSDIKM